jgi:hypothetical protein
MPAKLERVHGGDESPAIFIVRGGLGNLAMTGGHEVAIKFRRAPNGRRLARCESQRA